MMEKQIHELADKIINYSLAVKKGEKILLNVTGKASSLINFIVKKIYEVEGIPFLNYITVEQQKNIIKECSKEQIQIWAEKEVQFIKQMDGYIGIKAENNIYEMEDVPHHKYILFANEYLKPKQLAMVELEKWLLTRYPTSGMAQLAKMSDEKMIDVFFNACNIDYQKLSMNLKGLANLLNQTEKVRITGPNTEISFSKKDIPSYICDGKYNLPDGEIFTAPLLDSAEGQITFNSPSSFLGMNFTNVSLTFEKGEVVKWNSSNDQITQILNTDEGASRIGEFGLGLNPHIRRSMNNLLFDEKMYGSLHLALGQAFEMADNGNQSSIHWDLVLNQHKDAGGGELYFDNVLVRKDGIFVLPELESLNF